MTDLCGKCAQEKADHIGTAEMCPRDTHFIPATPCARCGHGVSDHSPDDWAPGIPSCCDVDGCYCIQYHMEGAKP